MQPQRDSRRCRFRWWRLGRSLRRQHVLLCLRRLGLEPLEDRRLLDGGGYTELLPDCEPSDQAFDAPGLVAHAQVQPWNRSDPGPFFSWSDLITQVEAKLDVSASFGIGDTVIVTGTGGQGLNVRVAPGFGQPEITDPDYPGSAPEGMTGTVLGGPVSADGHDWYRVAYGSGLYTGWSSGNWLQEALGDVMGIDVSHWQGTIQWPQVSAAGYEFAFCKATEGTGFTDWTFVTNIENGHTAGMLIGPYHFGRPDLALGAAEEAQHLVDVAGPYFQEGYLRPVLDLERGPGLGQAALSAWVHEFMNTVITETGIEPIIYVNSNYANNYLDASIAEYDLWIANWFVDYPNTGIWDTWSFWQYSNSGLVPGISGNVDLDRFNGDTPWLEGFAITELSINNVQLTEGNSGTKYFYFTVSLPSASSRAVTVDYQTANGTATAGSDYFARSGTLTFLAGQTSRTITVPVIGDTTFESDEAFYVNLSNPRGAILTDSQGRGTIQNDDAPPAQVIGWKRNDANEHYDELTSLAFTFSEDVSASIDVGDLSLMNDTTSTPVNMTGAIVQYNPPGSPTNTARWNLSTLSLPTAYYTATLSAAGITDAAGSPVDGDGDGTGGDDYVLIDILVGRRGDADLDGDVDFTDFNNLANNYTGPGGTGKDWTQGDFDGDGDVDFTDFNNLANNHTGPGGYLKGKGDSDLGETQQAGLFSGLKRTDPSGSRAAEVEETLALSRVRIALARLATLRSRDAAHAGIDRVFAHDAVLLQLGHEESKTPRASSGRREWLYEFEPTGIKGRPSKEATSAEDAVDRLLDTRLE